MPVPFARLLCVLRVALATMLLCIASSSSAATIDWETHGASVPMTNGQAVCTGPTGCEIAGDTVFESFNYPGGVVSVSTTAVGPGTGPGGQAHMGAAAFDSTPGVNSADPDLWVALGNILILQNNDHPNTTLDPTYGQVFDTPDDEKDPLDAGSFVLDFSSSVELDSIILVDINGGVNVDLTLTDSSNLSRVYSVPQKWTQDVDVCGGIATPGCTGYQVLDLTTLAPQPAEPGATGGDAVVSYEDIGFNPADVTNLTIAFMDYNGGPVSGGIDALVFTPEPGAASLLALGLLGLTVLRRR